jgi:hypothetical protein
MTTSAQRFGRYAQLWLAVAGCIAAAAITALMSSPPGFAELDAARAVQFGALASAAIVAAAILPFTVRRGGLRRSVWLTIAAASLVAGIVLFSMSGRAQRECIARYNGQPVIVGTELTPLGAKYIAANSDLSRDELLFDSQGNPERIWTRQSIDRCRMRVGATHYLWIPFLIVCLLASMQAIPASPLPIATGRAAPPSPILDRPARYDVFISYRHGGADAEFARQLLDTLEADGYRVAIDERDFAANENFLEEMECCIRESRFTVAIISSRYLESGNCQEEAIVSKVLDMDERRRRLIPLVIESVTMPAWLYGIVGIFCTKADAMVDPIDKLKATLGPPGVGIR